MTLPLALALLWWFSPQFMFWMALANAPPPTALALVGCVIAIFICARIDPGGPRGPYDL